MSWFRSLDKTRMFEVFCVGTASIIVGGTSIFLSVLQNDVSKRSLEVSEAELELVRLQTSLAVRDFAPDFDFHHSEHKFVPAVGVTDRLRRAKALDGHAKLFIEVCTKSNDTKRILIDGFFRNVHVHPKEQGESLNFYYEPELGAPASFNFQADFPLSQLRQKEKTSEEERKMSLEKATQEIVNTDIGAGNAFVYLDLTFYDSANIKRTEKYITGFPDEYPRPIESEPTYDRKVVVKDYLDKTVKPAKVDIAGLVERVREITTELSSLEEKNDHR